jgi:hypothetical protein
MRIARKSPRDQFTGAQFSIYKHDFYNPTPGIETNTDQDEDCTAQLVDKITLSYSQVKLRWIYLISEKQVPSEGEEAGEYMRRKREDSTVHGLGGMSVKGG